MQHPFEALRPEYERDLAIARILPSHQRQCEIARDKILGQLEIYEPVSELTGVPAIVQGAISYRESDCDPRTQIAQGWRWDQRSRDIPRIGPFRSKVEADVAGLRLDHLDQVAASPEGWHAAHALYEEELWNGFGPRNHGRRSGYVVGGTQLYGGGMYVRDGVWSASARDSRPGTLAVMICVAQARPDLSLPGLLPTDESEIDLLAPVPSPQPSPPGLGDSHDRTVLLQRRLNELGQVPMIDADGNYGKQTQRAVRAFQAAHGLQADGIAGPQTWAKIGELT